MSDRPAAVSPARTTVLEVLTGVRERDAYANLLLPALLGRHRPSREDAAFATELAYGTLRMAGLLTGPDHHDAFLDRVLERRPFHIRDYF
jgi:hypothetical protein